MLRLSRKDEETKNLLPHCADVVWY